MGAALERFAAWYRAHDPGLAALRRAGRAAILMPLLFAFADKVISNPAVAVFAAFGSFASLVLVDFGGPMGDRLRAQASFAAVGAVFVCVGTLASRSAWLAAAAMGVVGFCVLFAGAVSSVLASATVGLLLAFILPVCLKGPASPGPGQAGGVGARLRRRLSRDLAAVAGARARSAARRRRRGLPRARPPAAGRCLLPPRP